MNRRTRHTLGRATARGLALSSFLLATVFAASASGQSQNAAPIQVGGGVPGPASAPASNAALEQPQTLLSMDPSAPELSGLPGGVTPAFGSQPTRAGDWRFDFHGLIYVPLRVGFNTRLDPQAGQNKNVFHAPPVVPEDFQGFGYTNIEPDPWVQTNFSYGNRDVTATVIIAARSVTDGDSYFNPPDQLGINDAFLTFRVANTSHLHIKLDVGAFANRYGNMGEYDSGRYGTPLIARIGGVGITETGTYDFGSVTLLSEVGLMGQLNKAPLGVEPAGWNGYLDPNAGTSFVPHLHVGASYLGMGEVGVHLMRALSQDDRATPTNQPDGYIDVTAVDARLTMRRYGHLYAAFSRTGANHARAVSDVIQIMNTPGGLGLMNEYLGPNSGVNGSLTTLGAQYDLSIGNLLRYPGSFDGMGPDLVASVFGIYTAVSSEDPNYNGIKKLKYGAELSYSLLGWLAVSARYDRVVRDVADPTQTNAIISPRLIFRTGYQARDQVVFQYSHWFNGSNVVVDSGAPPAPNPTIRPDQDVLSLMASMWW